MEDVKWLLKKCGLPILILLFAVIAGGSVGENCIQRNEKWRKKYGSHL